MNKVETETETYYAVECMNLTDYTGWFSMEYGYDGVEKLNTVAEAKKRIRNYKVAEKAFSKKVKMEYRIVKTTETIMKEVIV